MRFESSKFVARLLSSSAVQLNIPHLMKVVVKDINRNHDPSVVELRVFVPQGRNDPIVLLDWTPASKASEVYSLPVTLQHTEKVASIVEARLVHNNEYILLEDVMTINLK